MVWQSFKIGTDEFDVFANASWIDLRQQTLPDSPEIRISGRVGYVSDFRARVGATWQHAGFSASLMANYLADSIDARFIPEYGVGSWTTFDASLIYTFDQSRDYFRNISVGLSAINLLDRDPPRTRESASYQGIAFDAANASANGRFVALTLRKRF